MNCMQLHVITRMMNDVGCILNSFYFVFDRNLVYSRQNLTNTPLYIPLLNPFDLINYNFIHNEYLSVEIHIIGRFDLYTEDGFINRSAVYLDV